MVNHLQYLITFCSAPTNRCNAIEQDTHLTHLSKSINRQRDISIQINEEIDVHTGLLEELDHEVDNTGGRMSGARKRLERVAKGIKGNGKCFFILVFI